jgi:hypothetical protein
MYRVDQLDDDHYKIRVVASVLYPNRDKRILHQVASDSKPTQQSRQTTVTTCKCMHTK